MKSPEEIRQDVRRKAFEDAADRLALEARHYLDAGVGGYFLDLAITDYIAAKDEYNRETSKQ